MMIEDLEEKALSALYATFGLEAAAEAFSAAKRFPPFRSAHEGWALILEELDELWEHVREKQGLRRTQAMRKEAVQVAAMALRFIELIDSGAGQK